MKTAKDINDGMKKSAKDSEKGMNFGGSQMDREKLKQAEKKNK